MPATSARPVTGKEALRRVLEKAGEPLKTKELVARELKVKGLGLAGKTPDQSLAAILAVENKKPEGLFERVAPATYRLRAADGKDAPPR